MQDSQAVLWELVLLKHDAEGMNAGVVMQKYLREEAKGFMEFLGQRP